MQAIKLLLRYIKTIYTPIQLDLFILYLQFANIYVQSHIIMHMLQFFIIFINVLGDQINTEFWRMITLVFWCTGTVKHSHAI